MFADFRALPGFGHPLYPGGDPRNRSNAIPSSHSDAVPETDAIRSNHSDAVPATAPTDPNAKRG